jgi:hypothetical protein
MPRSFAVTWDYRCPFARNAHEALIAGLREGRDWDVRFAAFSLDQAHVEEGHPAVWDRSEKERGTGVLSLTWGIAVRDNFSDHFLDFHEAVYRARFDEERKIGDEHVIVDIATKVGLDAEAVAKEVASGRPLETLAQEHSDVVRRLGVFGVPTFIDGDDAVFVRLMERGRVDDLERVLDTLSWNRLNEFKRTQIPR